MRKSHGPKFWSGAQDMDEAPSVAGGDFRTVRETNEVVVAIRAELAVEQFTGGDLERLEELSRLDVRECFFI